MNGLKNTHRRVTLALVAVLVTGPAAAELALTRPARFTERDTSSLNASRGSWWSVAELLLCPRPWSARRC